MESIGQSAFLRTLVGAGIAAILVAFWAGGAIERVALQISPPSTEIAAQGNQGQDGQNLDFTPTGSIGRPLVINPCETPSKR
jgi:hypothetical protein